MIEFKQRPLDETKNVNVSDHSPLKDFFVLLSGSLAILMFVYLAAGILVDFAIAKYPNQLETQFHKIFKSRFINEEAPLTPKEEELTRIFNKLLKQASFKDRQFTIRVNESNIVNATAAPGGFITVYAGLLNKARSENEIAYILAHELGHYEL